jgi:hypothetical protein
LVRLSAELSGYFYEYDNHKIAVFTLQTLGAAAGSGWAAN